MTNDNLLNIEIAMNRIFSRTSSPAPSPSALLQNPVHQIPDAHQIGNLRPLEFDLEGPLGRHDDRDMRDRIPAFQLAGLEIVAQSNRAAEHLLKDFGQFGAN